MSRGPDFVFMAEYIKNALYFGTVKVGKIPKSTADTHYFCIDNDLVYENYYSDFGPLNLGCVFKYCRILNEKLKQCLNRQTVVHYTSLEPKKKANAAYLLGCFGVLYLSLAPRDALKPLTSHGESYKPFQDATQGNSDYTISILDCLNAIKKARDLGFFNFQDFNYEEYERLDKIQGGDLNWIVPGKFLAFIGPVDYSVSLYHPPEMYIDYFLDNNVKIVIRLNKKLYDGNVFSNMGIVHYDLFFPDGSCPPRHILLKFLQISEDSNCAIAVHCKAGLGRTGTLIGCYLMKHYRMTSHEAIGWMRICRPGSVIGHQQGWLEKLECWLIKQGNLYRSRMYQDPDRIPQHEYGVYSIAERNKKKRPVVFQKSVSPPPPLQNHRPDLITPVRPQYSKVREAFNKTTEKESDWTVMRQHMTAIPKTCNGSDQICIRSKVMSRRTSTSGEGDLKFGLPSSRNQLPRSAKLLEKSRESQTRAYEPDRKKNNYSPIITTFRTSQAPAIKSLNDAKNYLMQSSLYKREKEKQLNAAVIITPTYKASAPKSFSQTPGRGAYQLPSTYSTASKPLTVNSQRRRLGRSPSPMASRSSNEQNRATNTPPTGKILVKNPSKTSLKAALSRLKLVNSVRDRDGSLGAGSLGATRDSPAPRARHSNSVKSDERPLATQGDMLNSIKFQRRLRESVTDKSNFSSFDKISVPLKKASTKNVVVHTNASKNIMPDHNSSKEKPFSLTRTCCSPVRPMSPKGRRTSHNPSPSY